MKEKKENNKEKKAFWESERYAEKQEKRDVIAFTIEKGKGKLIYQNEKQAALFTGIKYKNTEQTGNKSLKFV